MGKATHLLTVNKMGCFKFECCNNYFNLSAPALPVQTPVLNGFGQVFRLNIQ